MVVDLNDHGANLIFLTTSAVNRQAAGSNPARVPTPRFLNQLDAAHGFDWAVGLHEEPEMRQFLLQ
jgi:hypothetical protein